MQTEFTIEDIDNINQGLSYTEFSGLDHFFALNGLTQKNLHEHLGITKTFLTQIKNNPSKKGTLSLAKEISRMTGIRTSFFIRIFRFGYDNISMSEMEKLDKEEREAYNNRPELDEETETQTA